MNPSRSQACGESQDLALMCRGAGARTAALGCPVERSSTAPLPLMAVPGFAGRNRQRRPSSHHSAMLVVAFILSLACFASAQTLAGSVKNATNGKPAAGDEVVLLSLGNGMEEAGRTKADAKGKFSFKLDNPQAPHLVRVIHQEVTYHRMAPPGTTSVEVEVYDVGKKVEGIEVVADIMRIQVEQGQLEIMRAFAVQNNSKPPRTQMNERNLEFNIPEGAQMVESSAMTQGGNPLNTAPVPIDDKKTRYAFLFPLRPGTTQFQIAYQLPYTGSANIDPKSVYSLQHFVAILPKSMQFTAAPGTKYQAMNDPQQPDANVQVASGTELGSPLAFKISGEGVLEARQENAGQPSEGGSAPADSRPGGGLGPPIDAPDPLQRYRWYILAAFAAALIIGGVFIASRQQAAHRAARAKGSALRVDMEEEFVAAEIPASRQARSREVGSADPREQPSRTSMLLEGLKEELFELEVEHKQGRIGQQEYEKAKAALDHTLERALKREAQKA
jgi:hypothetical protein